jgi:hypothetical protein
MEQSLNSPNNEDRMIQSLQSIFTDPTMKIYYNEPKDEYIVEMNGIHCTEISIDSLNQQIIVKGIYKCSPRGFLGSGKYIVQSLVELSTQMGYQLVIEYDVSRISIDKGVSISLSGLYLLSKGQSWYNSMGFQEPNFERIFECCSHYISTTQTKILIKDKNYYSQYPIFQPIIEDIVFLGRSNTIRNIYERVMKVVYYLGSITKEENEEEVIKLRNKLITHLSNSVKTAESKMSKVCNYHFGEKYSNLVYHPPTIATERSNGGNRSRKVQHYNRKTRRL